MQQFLLLVLLGLSTRLAALPAPDFTVTDSDGNVHSLYGDYISQGKVVVLEVFFVNCPPCASHAPLVQSLYQAKKTLHPGKVEFLLLTNKANDYDAQVAQYKLSKNLTMPLVSADGGSLQALVDYQSGLYGTFLGTPTFIVIAPYSGEVFFDIRGNNPQGTMGELSVLIDQLAVPAPPSNICPSQTVNGVLVDSVRYSVDGATWDTSFVAGNYTLAKFPPLRNPLIPYTVSADKNDHSSAGVSTFDLVLMSKHLLGIDPLPTDWQKMAADVNSSNTVITFDIVETRKLILGIYDTFPGCRSWRFLPAESSQVNGYCYTFQCIKMGDVNGSFAGFGQVDAEERGGEVVPVQAQDRWLAAGQDYQFDLCTGAATVWQGLQMSLGFDPADVEVLGLASAGLPDFDAQAYTLGRQAEGVVPVSWVGGAQSAVLQPGQAWLTVRFRALRPVRLSEVFRLSPAPLRAEAYTDRAERQGLELRWQTVEEVAVGFVIVPNPAVEGAFVVGLESAAGGDSWLQVFDQQGRLVWAQRFALEKGENRLSVRLNQAAPGLYGLVVGGRAAGRVMLR